MMKIDILTLFPNMFDGFKSESIIKRAIDSKKVEINTVNFRDYAKNKHNKVDDTPYGGGNGMVLMCQPIFDAVDDIKSKNSKVILLTPQGKPYTQDKAYELSKEEHLIFVCGHYEGFDERIRSICDEEISIGDYVLTGGELPSMVITDSIVRLLPGVIEEGSHKKDSFNENLLDYPTYTKPREYKGMKVPDVLLSGDHKKIDEWRHNKQLKITNEKRPDLLNNKIVIDKEGIKENKTKIFIDDVKDIKARKISSEKTKYKLTKEKRISAITVFEPSKIYGYKLKSKNTKSGRILIVNEEFITKVVLKNVKRKIKILKYRFGIILENPDDNEGASTVLGEAEMLKQMVKNMYAKYLGSDALNLIIKNINLLIREFVKTRTLQTSMINYNEEKNRVK